MGTAAGIGRPPLALIYQNREGQVIRATLAVAFAIGSAISLLVFALAERVSLDHLLLALELLPALLLGLWGAGFFASFCPRAGCSPRSSCSPPSPG
jgi:uncharacterized protein